MFTRLIEGVVQVLFDSITFVAPRSVKLSDKTRLMIRMRYLFVCLMITLLSVARDGTLTLVSRAKF